MHPMHAWRQLHIIWIQRNQDKPDVVEERLKAYDSDSAHKKDYDFVVINDNLENCFKEVEKIILKKKDKK